MAEPDEEVFDLVCLLVSSARGALEEGVFTASLRLIGAAEKLSGIAARSAPGERRAFLEELAEDLRSGATASYFEGPGAYRDFLDDAVRTVATEIRRDNGL
jgi:hypothetical protein